MIKIRWNWFFKKMLRDEYSAMTIPGLPIILYKDVLGPDTIRHEIIHLLQSLETLVIGFYIIYIGNFLINLVRFGNWKKAYREILFEKEARRWESYGLYLVLREPWAWAKL